ncbi:SIS domain-containing protein [Paenibacillaceae bacterium WGS1546]|uniref:D-sedoheptulose-7-phosphate isomerase n=1 Tax=Cohnella sp. WGS1546 TaxID=3366810 RepID=UPI00372D6F53
MNALSRTMAQYPELRACERDIVRAYERLRDCFRGGGKLLLCGNGGSASDCEHIVGELMKGFLSERPIGREFRDKLERSGASDAAYLIDHLQGALPAISLVGSSAFMTAYANDVAADMAFAQQVFGYGKPGDVLFAISTSGNSANVLRALEVARAIGLRTVGLTGRTGGRMKELCDVAIRVPADRTPDVQERHLPIYHTLCIMLEEEFFGP